MDISFLSSISISLLIPFIAIAFIAVAFFVVQTLRIEKLQNRIEDLENKRKSFKPKGKFLNGTEEFIYHQLIKLSSDTYYVFPQVHLANIVTVSKDAKDYYNTLKDLDKYVDFVLVSKNDMLPKLVIECNGPDHEKDSRKVRDNFLKELLEACGIKLHFIKVSDVEKDLLIVASLI